MAVDPLGSARIDPPHLGFLTRSASFLKASGLGSFTCFVGKEPRNRNNQSSQMQGASEGREAL